jgi:hemerythrin superfamily protein
MPDPISQLVEDHNRLRRLFKQVPRMGGHQSVEPRARAICDMWTIHSRIEEELVYPVLNESDPESARKAEDDHEQAQRLVEKIRARDYADDGEVKADIETLEREIESHTRWEEDVVYPQISALDSERVAQIGRAVYERNQELLREFPQALEVSAETEGFIASPRI